MKRRKMALAVWIVLFSAVVIDVGYFVLVEESAGWACGNIGGV